MMESKPFSLEDIGPVVFTTRVIVASLAAGVLLFGLFVLASQGINLQAPLGLLTAIATVFGISTVPLWFVVPSMLVANQMRQIVQLPSRNGHEPESDTRVRQQDAHQLALLFQTKTLVGCALLEGAAFLALVACLLEHHIVSLVVATVLLGGILSQFPTLGGASNWIEQRLRQIEELRSLSHGTE
jgi:hypothetical protein